MLSSLTPVGESSRSQRWWVTATAFTVGSVLGGVATGVLAGSVGVLLDVPAQTANGLLAGLTVGAVALDLAGVTPPSLRRQVDRTWMTRLRGWVYGLGYGVQLGSGLVTYITSWATYLLVAAMVLVGDLPAAMLLGAVHGAVRGASVWTTARLTSAPAIRAHHRRLVALDGPMRRGARLVLVAVAVAAALAATG